MSTPHIYPESNTTLPEDRFYVADVDGVLAQHWPLIACRTCNKQVCCIDDGDDINTLIRRSVQHLSECKGESK